MNLKMWNLLPQRPQEEQEMVQSGIPPLVSRILASRGYDVAQAEELLSQKEALHDPFLMRDLDRAAQALGEAIKEGGLICVYGDYDCDGVAATVMMTDYLQNCGARVCYYIPHREKEGYGLNLPAIDELARLGVHTIVTVDNGISAIEEIAYAKSIGMRVIVTDHHKPREILPQADAVVDPHRVDCQYPFPHLSGVGVAFKLLCAMEGESGWGLLEQYGDLLAIGTVADVVELTGENRCFVRRGVEQLRDSQRIGLLALFDTAKVSPSQIHSETVAFVIAPRINAAGRLDTAELAAQLLLTESESEARELALQLETLNERRRALEKTVVDDVARQLSEDPMLSLRRVMVMSGSGWNAGIVGIVCSRLTERFDRPVLLIAEDGDSSKGSGRSIEGFSLIEAVSACSEPLTQYGGHPMAAGFSLGTGDIGTFAGLLEQYAAEHYPEMPQPQLTIDCLVSPSQLTVQHIRELEHMEPFGCKNEPPVFGMTGLRLERIIPLSEGRHIKLRLSRDGETVFLLCFGMRSEQIGAVPGDTVDIAFTVSVNEYQGVESLSLKYKGLCLTGADVASVCTGRQRYESYRRGELTGSQLVPQRDEVAAVYRYLRSAGPVFKSSDAVYCHIARQSPLDYTRFRIALDVLSELGLIAPGENGCLSVEPTAQKVDLASSGIVRSLLTTI